MCGLHALNNALSSATGRRVFSIEHVSDGLETLRAEHARDGLPWRVKDHASPSGDYSLVLLQWLLQNR